VEHPVLVHVLEALEALVQHRFAAIVREFFLPLAVFFEHALQRELGELHDKSHVPLARVDDHLSEVHNVLVRQLAKQRNLAQRADGRDRWPFDLVVTWLDLFDRKVARLLEEV